MEEKNILAVASSVSADKAFDTLDTIAYAIDNGFRGIQTFLNQEMINNAELRGKIRSMCRDKRLALIAHAPATLDWTTVSDDNLNLAAHDLLMSEHKAHVVHHYNETLNIDESLKCLWYLHDQRFTICLENFFLFGAQTGEKCFKDYLRLLLKARQSGIDIMPVLDIPRLYDPKVNLAHIALELLEEAFGVFKLVGTSIILHLIDIARNSDSQSRDTWCPVGQGMIPYTKIFSQLTQREIPIYMTVLEFEDKINPIISKEFLAELLF